MRPKSVRFVPLSVCAELAQGELVSLRPELTGGKRVAVSFMAHFRTLNHQQRAKLARKVAKIQRNRSDK